MRRTILIDDGLMEEAREVLGTDSIRATVEMALREAIRKRRLEQLRQSLGTWDLALDPEELERLRHAD